MATAPPLDPAARQGWGERIRWERDERAWSQDTLSRKSGVARATISALESGRRTASLTVQVSLADALGLDVRVLFPLDHVASLALTRAGARSRRAARAGAAAGQNTRRAKAS